jgi:hypothetical protein
VLLFLIAAFLMLYGIFFRWLIKIKWLTVTIATLASLLDVGVLKGKT